jgi:dTDP-4-amino-4,6-dideoxygalactose transaminase
MPYPEIPFVDIARQHARLRAPLAAAIEEVLDSCCFIGGGQVEGFERAFAAHCEVSHCVSMSNGTDALWIALMALEIGPGDEVITSATSFFATAEAIGLTGAVPVFCDVNERATLDVDKLGALTTARTKAILPVHLYGLPADMDAILDFARKRRLWVIEDCAQAAGARYRGRRVGGIGDIGCFSFYPTKNLGAMGDAGAITTNDGALATRCRMLANHGALSRYQHFVTGTNSRLDALQASVLRVKLQYLDAWNAERADIAQYYRALLAEAPVELIPAGPEYDHAHHLFVVRVAQRNAVLAALRNAGIGADIHYPAALPMLPVYRTRGFEAADYPKACRHAATALSLPIFPGLHMDEIRRVAAAVLAALQPQ